MLWSKSPMLLARVDALINCDELMRAIADILVCIIVPPLHPFHPSQTCMFKHTTWGLWYIAVVCNHTSSIFGHVLLKVVLAWWRWSQHHRNVAIKILNKLWAVHVWILSWYDKQQVAERSPWYFNIWCYFLLIFFLRGAVTVSHCSWLHALW